MYDNIPWGIKPPSLSVSIPSTGTGMVATSYTMLFDYPNVPQDKSGEKWWSWESEDPENTTLSGLVYRSGRGVRLSATLDFFRLTRAQIYRLQEIYNRANHLVNRGATITLMLHQDDDTGFAVRFTAPPVIVQYGVYPALRCQFEGVELLDEIPLRLKRADGEIDS